MHMSVRHLPDLLPGRTPEGMAPGPGPAAARQGRLGTPGRAGRAGTRVMYVDNDPIVHVHANALLAGTGTTGVVLADLREPEAVLAHPADD